MKRILIFGSTGSIGQQTLEVLKEHPKDWKIIGLVGNTNEKLLKEQQKKFKIPNAVLLSKSDEKQIIDLIKKSDIVVNAISGTVGIAISRKILEHKKTLLLANKESLVSAGEELKKIAQKNHVKIIPIDSELTGIIQCIDGHLSNEIEKIILTCSGGPFYGKTKNELQKVTLEQTLKHPTWKMGKKITVDSATLMNKAFELIATSIFFDIPEEKIEIVIHPESIVHAIIQWKDGNLTAALSPTDMRHTIQYALYYPKRKENMLPRLHFPDLKFHFYKPNENIFPSLAYGRKAARIKGNVPARLNTANDEAVENFLNGQIKFLEIFKYIQSKMNA